MGNKICFGILFYFSVPVKYWPSETRKELLREAPSSQAAGSWAICYFLMVDDTEFGNSFKKYGNEVDEACDCRELISGVQIYFELGFWLILYFLEIF